MGRYESVMQEMFSRHPSFQSHGKEAYHPGLEGMELMDGMMGHPHRRYKCIHVAGTNGKGSVCNMLAAALAAQGFKVGLYTSPHLLDFRERMRIISPAGSDPAGIGSRANADDPACQLISREAVLDFCGRWQEHYDRLGLSFFEITTLMAFDWFARAGVDRAVIETGLGGRLDSTNIIRPELSVITNIGLDHCDILGGTLPEIAFEKAGIIKPRVPVVIGEGCPEINPVFEKKVLYTNLPEPSFGGDRNRIMSLLHYAEKEPLSLGGATLPEAEFEAMLRQMDLPGTYQRANLRTVLCALQVLEESAGKAQAPDNLTDAAGTPTDSDGRCGPAGARIREALTHTAAITGFRGRWERIGEHPEIICDIGHNAHGLRHNFDALQGQLAQGRRVIIIYGSVSDKDVAAAGALLPAGADLILTAADNPRALPPGKLLSVVSGINALHTPAGETTPRFRSLRTAPSVAQAVDLALSEADPEDLIYIGGSTYLVAEAIRHLNA